MARTKPVGREIRYGSAVLGLLIADRLRKVISGSLHFLRKPVTAIALDLRAIDEAQAAGVDLVEAVDTETNRTYFATIAQLRAAGFDVARGYGRQVALPLTEWFKSERLARQWAPKAEPEQLDLWGSRG